MQQALLNSLIVTNRQLDLTFGACQATGSLDDFVSECIESVKIGTGIICWALLADPHRPSAGISRKPSHHALHPHPARSFSSAHEGRHDSEIGATDGLDSDIVR